MNGSETTWGSMVWSWLPVLVMIGAWIYIMRKLPTGKQAAYLDRQQQYMAKSEELLERIAVALEERNHLGR